MYRYLLFSGLNYYPDGGWADYKGGSDDLNALRQKADSLECDWWEIVDALTLKIVAEK